MKGPVTILRRQRAGWRLLLGLLVALGVLGMHANPGMAGMSVSGSGTRIPMASHPVAMGAELPPIAVAEVLGREFTLPLGGHGQGPAEHHMLAPCLANAAPVVLIGGHDPALSDAVLPGTPLRDGVATKFAGRSGEGPSRPPDLHKLCIFRT